MSSLLSRFEGFYANEIQKALDKVDNIESSKVCSDNEISFEENDKSKTVSPSPKRNNRRKRKLAKIEEVIDLDEIEDDNVGGKLCDTSIESISFPDNSIIIAEDTENNLRRPVSSNSDIQFCSDQIPVPIPRYDSSDIIVLDEEVVKQPTRRSKRLKQNIDQQIIQTSLPTTSRRKRTKKTTNNTDIEVITFDAEYVIPECSYMPKKNKSVKETNGAEKPEPKVSDTNDTFSVFVSWDGGDCVKFEISKYQLLKSIYQHFSQLEGIPVTQVLLYTSNYDVLTPDDTPDSLKFNCIEHLRARKTNIEQEFKEIATKTCELDKNAIKLKVLLQNQRPLMLSLKKNQSMRVIIAKCAGKLECSEDDVVLYFDGEKINPDDTPDDLDLEDGECVDAHRKK